MHAAGGRELDKITMSRHNAGSPLRGIPCVRGSIAHALRHVPTKASQQLRQTIQHASTEDDDVSCDEKRAVHTQPTKRSAAHAPLLLLAF